MSDVMKQNEKVIGYKTLSEEQIKKGNEIKLIGKQIDILVKELTDDSETDGRWVAIGKTNMQQGLMALTRAVFKPDFF